MITFIYEDGRYVVESEMDVEINVDMCLSELKAKDERIAELKSYITNDVFLRLGDIISLEYGRVGGTDKDTKIMEICRSIHLKGEQALKGKDKENE